MTAKTFGRVRLPTLALGLFLACTTNGRAETLRQTSSADLRADLERARSLLTTCAEIQTRCNPALLPGSQRVADAGHSFVFRWIAERDAVDAASRQNDPARRRALLAPALADLDATTRELDTPAAHPDLGRARNTLDAVLRTPEFQREESPSLFERLVSRIFSVLSRLFGGLGEVSARMPWLPVVLLGLTGATIVAALLLLLRRILSRQRIGTSLSRHAEAAQWNQTPYAWSEQADAFAAQGDWRDAIHSLLWAALALLEQRRLWRDQPARTPREHLRLLPAGSALEAPLRRLTLLDERLWYGLADASREDYGEARRCFDRLHDPPQASA